MRDDYESMGLGFWGFDVFFLDGKIRQIRISDQLMCIASRMLRSYLI